MHQVLQILIVLAVTAGATVGGATFLACCQITRLTVFGEMVPENYLAAVPAAEIARATAAGDVRYAAFVRWPSSEHWVSSPIGGPGILSIVALMGAAFGLLVASRVPLFEGNVTEEKRASMRKIGIALYWSCWAIFYFVLFPLIRFLFLAGIPSWAIFTGLLFLAIIGHQAIFGRGRT